MRKYRLYIFLMLIIVSCGTEKPEPDNKQTEMTTKVTDTAAQIKQADTVTEVSITLHALKNISFQQKCDSFIAAYKANYTEGEHGKRHMLMRFENVWMKQVLLNKNFKVKYGDSEVSPQAYIGFYEYTDSTQCANAYSNWLACFGSDCNQVVPGEEKQIKSTPGFYIINEKEIITLDYPIEHEKNNWSEMKKNLRTMFAGKNSRLIVISAKGKVTWEN